MDTRNVMKDPFYAIIMFQIESVIHDADSAATDEGIELKDSHIKSCLSKVKILAKGRKPKAKPKTEREEFILELAENINAVRSSFRSSTEPEVDFEDAEPISNADWLLTVKAVEDSLKLHTASGTRFYLDFLAEFVAKARSE